MHNFLNEKFLLRDTGCSNGVDAINAQVHRWYVIKEAFSPRLVERAISDAEVESSETVIDPFCGSGTVPLTASLKECTGLGIEVNPFLAFVSQSKLLRPRITSLRTGFEQVVQAVKRGKESPLEKFSTFSNGGEAEKWLFNESILRSFEGGWHSAEALAPSVRDLCRLALLAAAMDTCNATHDGKCLRYRKDWSSISYGRREFLEAFEARMAVIQEDLALLPRSHGSSNIRLGDSRQQMLQPLKEKFKLCITSPPYLNSFDYSDVYRPELFLGKFVSSNDELRNLRFQTIRSHVQVDWAKPVYDDFGLLYNNCIQQLKEKKEVLWSRRIPQMVQAYFEDIRGVLKHLHKQARPDASLWLVVSTSAYAGVEIPVDLIIGEIGAQSGWFLREVGVLRYMRTSGQHWRKWAAEQTGKPQLRESVIILDASRPQRSRQ